MSSDEMLNFGGCVVKNYLENFNAGFMSMLLADEISHMLAITIVTHAVGFYLHVVFIKIKNYILYYKNLKTKIEELRE